MAGQVNPRFDAALAFAVRAHAAVGHERKGTDFPYVAHPIRVAEILDRFEFEDDVIVAGFLHDTIEDTNISAEEIRGEFGASVAELVVAASEPDKSAPWKERKQHTLDQLRREARPNVLALVAADKLDNIRSLSDTLRHLGAERTWKFFNAEQKQQHWYYRSLAEILLSRNPDSRLFRTLDFETQTLFPDERHPTNLFPGKPLGTPHDARGYLADPIRHWKPDHSALSLATSWVGANGIPANVARVLATCPAYSDCRLIEGFFEREVDLGTRGRPSQTDLLALVGLTEGYGVIAVEGKALETFGPIVSEWNDTDGKQARLDDLCDRLGLDPSTAGNLRYQLLHRTVSALLEARRYGAAEALMLVHSFDPKNSSLDDYQVFAAALGLGDARLNAITEEKMFGGINLRLGWVAEHAPLQKRPLS